MQAAFDYAVEYVHTREQFNQPIGTFQLMQGTRLSRIFPYCYSNKSNFSAKIAGSVYYLYPYPSIYLLVRYVYQIKRKSELRLRRGSGVRPRSR